MTLHKIPLPNNVIAVNVVFGSDGEVLLDKETVIGDPSLGYEGVWDFKGKSISFVPSSVPDKDSFSGSSGASDLIQRRPQSAHGTRPAPSSAPSSSSR